jgi:glycosyltransferase involved in cell wall biosynthesis
MRIVRPDYQFVIVFPDSKSHYKYDDDGLFSLPNVFRVGHRISPRKMSHVISFNGDFYDQLFRKIGFDVILCNQVEIAAQLGQAGQATFASAGRPLNYACHYYVIHKSLPYLFENMMEHVAFAQIMGARFADYNIFNSEYCKWMLNDTAKIYLNDDSCKAIEEKSCVIPMGTLEPSLRYVKTSNDIPIIIYNHRLQTYKNYKKTFEILADLYDRGLKSYPFVELKLCATREEYLRVLVQGDINVTNTQHETFCMSAVESMAVGQPVVAPNGLTFPEITGRDHTRYPYLFESDSEQVEYIRRLLTDRKERQKWGVILSRYVTDNFNNLKWAENYATTIESHLSDEKFVPNTKEDVKEDLAMRLRLNDGCEIKNFWNEVAQRKINGRIPWGSQSLSYTKLVRLVRLVGGSVKIVNGEQRVFA